MRCPIKRESRKAALNSLPRFIEFNSVRARMTADPTSYMYSNCADHCGLRQDPVRSPHAEYTTLAAPPHARTEANRQLLHELYPTTS